MARAPRIRQKDGRWFWKERHGYDPENLVGHHGDFGYYPTTDGRSSCGLSQGSWKGEKLV